MNATRNSQGISILEVVIAAAIILILTTAIAGAWRSYIVITRISNERTQAALLLEEASDALQFIRDKGWGSNFSTIMLDVPYYLKWNSGTYILDTTAPALIQNIYTRKIVFSDVTRDGQDNISNSGIVDYDTKKVLISIYTNQTPPEVSIQAEMLIHDVYNN
ncbi:MAG: hypothetical protein Q7S72_00015 [Candidatus Taylorbacteria bacterium]|nr:hypothetical protein [Candidatus Taylorbacteria bacterium]